MVDKPHALALEGIKKGTSVIPVGKDKIPLISWKEYQDRVATEEEVNSWWEKWPDANVGIVTGKISNITVIDVEKDGDPTRFPETFTVKTGGGGWHLYYEYFPIQNKTRIYPLTDIRGDGGYVVGPTSTHKSGNKYEIVRPAKKPQPFPAHMFGEKKISPWKEKIVGPIEDGSRNSDFTSIVGGLLFRFPIDEWEKIVWPLVKEKNSAQTTPLGERELRASFLSICQREMRKRNSGGEIKDLVTEATEEEIRIKITLPQAIIWFKARNFFGNLLEANVLTWLEKASGLSPDISFGLKIKSDSNKEQWARILSKTFDRKEDKEVYPWTILVNKVAREIEKTIVDRVQDFSANEAVAKKTEWLLEPFLQEGQINTVFGMGSSGKTLLALYFASLIEGNSLLVDYENDIYSWKDKLNRMVGENQSKYAYFDSEQIPLASQVEKIKEVIKRRNIALVIIDSASMASGDSTSDEEAAIRLMAALKLLKTTVLLIAHQRKNDGDKTPIGSIQYENQARNVWNVKSVPDQGSESTLHIACSHTKANNTYLRRTPVGFRVVFDLEAITITKEDAMSNFEEKFTVLERIRNLLFETPKLEYQEIMEFLDISKESVTKNLSMGKKKNLFQNDSGKWSLCGDF